MQTIKNWEINDLKTTLGLVQNDIPFLHNWLNCSTSFNQSERNSIERLRQKLNDNIMYWNEDELITQFIALIFLYADMGFEYHNIFSKRTIKTNITGIKSDVNIDLMLAKGKQKPIPPYFFICKLKQPTKRKPFDSKEQLLSELLAAQACNDNKSPIYGCYILGRNWFFVVLNNSEYAASNSYNASDDDIYQIIAILRQVKINILNLS